MTEEECNERWGKVAEILKRHAIPKLGKIPGGRDGKSALFQDLLQLAQSVELSRGGDSGNIRDVRESLNKIARAAGALSDALHTAPSGVWGTLCGIGLDTPVSWIEDARTAGILKHSDILILRDDGEFEEEPPALEDRAKALCSAATKARASLLEPAQSGGNRDWEKYRRGSPNLNLMKECLLFLVKRKIKPERKYKALARTVRWALDNVQPDEGWGQNESALTVAWWKVVGPHYEKPEQDWPGDIRKIYIRGPSALISGDGTNQGEKPMVGTK